MSVINTQPSPFGHLTRERHIESIVKLQRKKPTCLQPSAEGTSHKPEGQILDVPSDSEDVQKILPPLEANACSFRDPSHSLEARMNSITAQPGKRYQRAKDLPPGPSSCKERPWEWLRPTQLQVAGRHPGLSLPAGIYRLSITAKAEHHGCGGSSQRRSYIVNCTARERDLLVVTEDYKDCCFYLCGPARPCHLCLQDQEGRVILWFCRPFRIGLGCLRWCQMEMKVLTSDNELLGTVRQRCHLFSHLLEVCDAQGLVTMQIHGSCTKNRCFTEQEFQVLSSTGGAVATIWKKWPGFNEECNMDHETFGVDVVAPELSSDEMAHLLAATFLLNFMFFEVS